MYEAGATLAEIAQEIGVSAKPVRRVLLEAGVELRSPGRPSSLAGRDSEVLALYDKGVSIVAIAERFGTSPKTVRKLANVHGRAPRSPGQPSKVRGIEREIADAYEQEATFRQAGPAVRLLGADHR